MSKNVLFHINVQIITITQLSYNLLKKRSEKRRLTARYLGVSQGEYAYFHACVWGHGGWRREGGREEEEREIFVI